MLSIARYSEIA